MWTCGNCGDDLRWNNDFDFCDLHIEGEGIASIYSCDNCNLEAEIYIPSGD
tara:strand:- start:980 stop:1132 length:153 start_codon:yes stop_codon:yes gene_type:complete